MGNTTKITWRFVSGHHLDGEHRTDAGVFRRGTKVVHASGRAGRWSHLSRAERALIRLGSTAVVSATGYGYAVAPTVTIDSLYAAAGLSGLVGVERGRRKIRRRRHYRTWVRPLHYALSASALVPISRHDHPDTYMIVPQDYATNDAAEIRINLPEGFSGDKVTRSELQRLVCDKLGLSVSDTVVNWRVAGREPFVTLQIAPRPPKRVTWSEALHAVEAVPESAPLIGLGTKGVSVSVDLDAESPHILVSASSGGGKSVIVRVIACQLMHHGARTLILDAKRHSHRWARGLPGVTYCRSTEEIHDALIWAAAEGERRNVLVDEGGDDAAKNLPRIVVIAEEMNATMSRLQKYWETVRGKDDPKRSPAVDALGEVLFMGRAVRVNVLAVAQMMTARTLGGPEARENFATRILARYSVNNWKMLVPEIQPMPRSSRHAGRVQVCIAGEATETQVLFPSEAEAREWAMSGAWAGVTVDQDGIRVRGAVQDGLGQPASQGNRPSSVLDTATAHGGLRAVPDLPAEPPQLAGVTLSEAIDDGLLKLKLGTAQKASNRDPEFPDPIGKRGTANLYDPTELARWQANRPRAAESA